MPWTLTFSSNYQQCAWIPVQLVSKVKAGKEEEQETRGGPGHNKNRGAEIASEEVHSQNNTVFPAILLAAMGHLLHLIGWKLAFRFCQNKGLDCLTRLEQQQRDHCKESCSHPFSPPIFSVTAALNYTFFPTRKERIHHWLNLTTQTAICPVTGNSFSLFVQSWHSPLRNWTRCLDMLHHVQTLTCCNLKVTQLSLIPHALLSGERVKRQNVISLLFVLSSISQEAQFVFFDALCKRGMTALWSVHFDPTLNKHCTPSLLNLPVMCIFI